MKTKSFLELACILGVLAWIVGSSCLDETDVGNNGYLEHVTYVLTEDGKQIRSDSITTIDLEFDWIENGFTIPVYLDGHHDDRIYVVLELFTKSVGQIPVLGTQKDGFARVLYLPEGTFAGALEFQQGFVTLNSIGLEDDPNETISGSYDVTRQTDSSIMSMKGSFKRKKFN